MKFYSFLLLGTGWFTLTSPAKEITVTESSETALRAALAEVKSMRESRILAPVLLKLPTGICRLRETVRFGPETVGEGLTLRSADPANPMVFSGARSLPLGRRDGNRWCFPIPDDALQFGPPRHLLIDDQLKRPARFPNAGWLRIEKTLPDRRSGFTVTDNDLPFSAEALSGTCDLIFLHDWSSSRLPVASWDPTTRQLRTLGPIGCSAPHYAIDHFEKQPRFALEGAPELADQPGEWFIDPAKQELVLLARPEAEKPPRVEIPWLDELFYLSGTDKQPLRNMRFESIRFTGSRFPMPPGGFAGAQASMHEPRNAVGRKSESGRPMLSSAVHIELAEGVQVTRCLFEGLGNTGLWIGSRTRQVQVANCRFRDLGGNALNLGENNARRTNGNTWYRSAPEQVPTGHRVMGCEISHCGTLLPGAVAIWAALHCDLRIEKNYIHDVPYTGISLGWIWNDSDSPARNNRVTENRIACCMQLLSDGGGIYTLGKQPGSLLATNTITDIPLNAGRAESNGMFLDQGSTGFTIRNNIMRRLARSPLRFHQAGENRAVSNRWELADDISPLRFNRTPPERVTARDNEVLPTQRSIYLIGNSLTWDTVPSRLDGHVQWHVDCGKPLPYIAAHPESPCVKSSRIWPDALRSTAYDVLCVQPHNGSGLEQDVAAISQWMTLQPKAEVILHTGWAFAETLEEEYADDDPAGPLTHSDAYYDALRERLQKAFPGRNIRSSRAMHLLQAILQDVEAGKAPIQDIKELYRDNIHMTYGPGRWMMHNALRQALDQPRSDAGFPKFDPKLKAYLGQKLDQIWQAEFGNP